MKQSLARAVLLLVILAVLPGVGLLASGWDAGDYWVWQGSMEQSPSFTTTTTIYVLQSTGVLHQYELDVLGQIFRVDGQITVTLGTLLRDHNTLTSKGYNCRFQDAARWGYMPPGTQVEENRQLSDLFFGEISSKQLTVVEDACVDMAVPAGEFACCNKLLITNHSESRNRVFDRERVLWFSFELGNRNGHLQGYNAQAMVTKEQIIVAAEVTQQQNDVQQLHPMLKKTDEELNAAGVKGKVRVVLADAGYYSEANVRHADPEGPELLLATRKNHKQRQAMKEAGCPRGRIPKNATVKERMERKLLTKRGKELYKLRSKTVEPIFGQIKEGRACETFLRRGTSAVRSEWRLICAGHNLLKLWRSGKFHLCMRQREVCWA